MSSTDVPFPGGNRPRLGFLHTSIFSVFLVLVGRLPTVPALCLRLVRIPRRLFCDYLLNESSDGFRGLRNA